MSAVIKTGGKQYRVNKSDVIEVELLKGKVGDAVKFEEVLLFSDGKGTEAVPANVKKVVEGKIVAQFKAPKLYIQKHRRRKNSRTRTGHRQQLTRVEITAIKNS